MSNDYYKAGKLYNLTSTTTVTIPGASFIHAIYNAANAAQRVTINDTYLVHMPTDGNVTFPVPLPFSGLKTNVGTATILYS